MDILRNAEKDAPYLGFSSGSGSLRPSPTGFLSASSAVRRCSSASTFPWWDKSNSKTLSSWPVTQNKDQLLTLTHRELKLIVFIPGHERPPAFDSLLLEDGHHGHLCLICHHLESALFGSLSTTGETVKVEFDCTLVEKQKFDESNLLGGWTWLSWNALGPYVCCT